MTWELINHMSTHKFLYNYGTTESYMDIFGFNTSYKSNIDIITKSIKCYIGKTNMLREICNLQVHA